MSEPFSIRMPPDVRSIRLGAHQALLIDDFLEDPQALVAAACEAHYQPCPGWQEQKGYPGQRAAAPSAYSDQLGRLLEPLIKANFDVPAELALKTTPCAFSLTTVAPTALGPLQRIPHFDASSPHYMACLLYLCGPQHGGTGFYRHRGTGIQQVTAANKDVYAEASYAELERQPPPARYFDAGNEQFEFLGMVPARFNRLVLYRGSLLHTACIHPDLSISADPRQGRLTVNTFVDF